MTLSDAQLTLGRTITDLANAGTIDGNRYEYNRRCGLAQAILAAAAAGDESKAGHLGGVLAGPRDVSPAAPKSWRPVAELAFRLGRQVAQDQTSTKEAA